MSNVLKYIKTLFNPRLVFLMILFFFIGGFCLGYKVDYTTFDETILSLHQQSLDGLIQNQVIKKMDKACELRCACNDEGYNTEYIIYQSRFCHSRIFEY